MLWNHLSSSRHIGIRVLKATRKGLDDLIVIGRSILRHESSRRESILQPTLFKKKEKSFNPGRFQNISLNLINKKNNPHLTTKVIPQLWKLSTSNIWIILADSPYFSRGVSSFLQSWKSHPCIRGPLSWWQSRSHFRPPSSRLLSEHEKVFHCRSDDFHVWFSCRCYCLPEHRSTIPFFRLSSYLRTFE